MNCAVDLSSREYERYDQTFRYPESQPWRLLAVDPFDDGLIRHINDLFARHIRSHPGLNDQDMPYMAIACVQSFASRAYKRDPYVARECPLAKKKYFPGNCEYPQFPFETLYDESGDCEDSAILLAALLYDQGYDVALIHLPGHMALGLKEDPSLLRVPDAPIAQTPSRFTAGGSAYCYVETTHTGWAVGEMPSRYEHAKARIEPVVSQAYLMPTYKVTKRAIYGGSAYQYQIKVMVTNIGCETTVNGGVSSWFSSRHEGQSWGQKHQENLSLDPQEDYTMRFTALVPASETWCLRVKCDADNAPDSAIESGWQWYGSANARE